jgi:uncharacterized protein DUF5681
MCGSCLTSIAARDGVMAAKKPKRQPTGDYPIGYCRPPADHRFRPGQSGNPTGQQKGSQVKTTADELKEIAASKVPIRDGDKTRKVSLAAANLLAHATNGAKGNAQSTALFFKLAEKMGYFDHQASGDAGVGPPDKPRPSDILLPGLDLSALSRDEQVELSKLTARIDRVGSIWALSASELERVRELVLKGGNRGQANVAIRH